jgi:hypothetical protein
VLVPPNVHEPVEFWPSDHGFVLDKYLRRR